MGAARRVVPCLLTGGRFTPPGWRIRPPVTPGTFGGKGAIELAEIKVGTCAWADHEDFYPGHLKPGDRLSYYARFFPLVEVDSTYYALQPQRNFALWAQRTPDHFRFNVKAYGAMTRHHREPRPGEEDIAQVFRKFDESIQPLRAVGKLAALHFQFPPWFVANTQNRDWLQLCREFFPQDLLSIEFRHRSWFAPAQQPETLQMLTKLDAVHVICDEPQVGSGTVPLITAVTNRQLAMIRFHGRNAGTWYKPARTTAERFDYLYSRAELQSFVPLVADLAGQAAEIHLLMNNNRANYAVRNALDLMNLLGLAVPSLDERGVPVTPPDLNKDVSKNGERKKPGYDQLKLF